MRAWLLAAIALVLLNASLTFENVWPTAKIAWSSALSIELAICVLLLALARDYVGGLPRRILPSLWVILTFGHYLDVTAPGLYGRPFNLYWDTQHLGNVVAMTLRDVPGWVVISALAGAVGVLVLTFLLSRFALITVAGAMNDRRARIALGTAAAALVATFGIQQMSPRFATALTFADPVTPAYVKQARSVTSMLGPSEWRASLGPSPDLDAQLAGLHGEDVLLIFIESYGALTFDLPGMADALAATRREFSDAIRDSGRRVVSGFVSSPTFGGSSWLAHLSLLSGVEVRDQSAYTALMSSSRDTVVTSFRQRGYRTVALMPGMRQQWPEGAFYGFDAIYGRTDLEYEGPEFGWWSIPDQFALAKLDALERNRRPRPPLFVVFPTSTTHWPFGPVAPYQPDWSLMLTKHAFDGQNVDGALAARPDVMNPRPSYVRALEYEFATLGGYLRHHDEDLLMILIGDHQPPGLVTGPNASWDVPVHVIGRQHVILDRLLEHGFQNGLYPARPEIGDMHALLPMLLNAFSTSAHPAQAAY
jgi:hypothetical protein